MVFSLNDKSSDLNDIMTAIPWVDAIGGNLVVVGMGQNVNAAYLQYLTLNVITNYNYTDILVTAVRYE